MENRTLKEQFPLRLPDGMRDRIKQEAESHFRSMNAEIIYQLCRVYGEQPETKKTDAASQG
jgi:hypothetical protein